MAQRRARFAISGEPGRSRFLTRYLAPSLVRIERTTCSGFVSFWRTRPRRADVLGSRNKSGGAGLRAQTEATRSRPALADMDRTRPRCFSTASRNPRGKRRVLARARARKPAVAFSDRGVTGYLRKSAMATGLVVRGQELTSLTRRPSP